MAFFDLPGEKQKRFFGAFFQETSTDFVLEMSGEFVGKLWGESPYCSVFLVSDKLFFSILASLLFM